MSFLSRLFKKKKEEPPEPPRPAPPAQRETPKPPPPSPPKTESFATVKTPAPPPPREPVKPAPATAPLGSRPSEAAKPAPQTVVTPPAAPQTVVTPAPQTVVPPPPPEAKPSTFGETQMFAETQLMSAVRDDIDARGTLPEVEAARAHPVESPAPGVTAEQRASTAPLESQSAGTAPQNAMAATMPLSASPDLGEGFFSDLDDLLDDFDMNFDAAIGSAKEPSPFAEVGASDEGHGVVVDQTPVRELFADIAANYVRAVRNFMIEINRGDTAKEWIDICQPAVHSIKRAAEKMDLTDVHAAIEDFDAVLELAVSSEGRLIKGDVREELISTYEELVRLMPQAFTLEAERDQRESIIIHSLLMQVADVKKVTVDKLYAAGLTTLEVFFLAKPEDLAATAGIPDWLAAKIVDKFQAYRAEIQSVTVDASRSAERAKLKTLINDLRQQQDGYERASSGWTEDAAEEKKRLRQARQDSLLQINVVLAQMGEVDLIHEIEKLPFERRIDRLTSYIEESPADNVPL